MFAPINVRTFTQGLGAPLIDPCTTVRRFTHDDGSGQTEAIYKGIAICPFGFANIWWSVALTWFERSYENKGDHPCERATN